MTNSRLKRFPKAEELFTEDGELVLDEDNLEHLNNLVSVVVNKHFKNYNEYEELTSLGIAKVVEVLKMGEYDPEKGSLKNFLYTSIRNACTNYLYHFKNSNKEVIADELPEGHSIWDSTPLVDDKMIRLFIKKYPIVTIDTMELIGCLKLVGFPIKQGTKYILSDEIDYHKDKAITYFTNWYFNHL